MIVALDLFCGPGGISEGLRMAGIDTVYAIDYDKDACATFALNHPETTVVCADVLSIDPNDLPDVDFIVGGPPCVNFSTSKGSRANILDGLKLVQWYLRVIAIKKPKYWIMENVPRVANHLPEKIPFSWIGIDKPGFLDVPVRAQYNTADFGVAQARNRYLIGNYPMPEKTNEKNIEVDLYSEHSKLNPWRSLGEVINVLPSPDSSEVSGDVVDPNYGFCIPKSKLTDHFMNTILSEDEVEGIRNAKTNHPYMGRMAFPDELNRPARTVVATQLGRETLVLDNGDGKYRRATIRECATIQGFPLTYQFTGKSIGSRYRQAGDAVPPLLMYSIGKIISGVEKPIVRSNVEKLTPPLKTSFKHKHKQFTENPRRKFAEMIPGKEVRGSRIELDNLNYSRYSESEEKNFDQRIWSTRLYVGEGKNKAQSFGVSFIDAIQNIVSLIPFSETSDAERWLKFLADIEENLPQNIDPINMQKRWSRNEEGVESPHMLVEQLSELVNRNFPTEIFSQKKLRFSLSNLKGGVIKLRVRLVASAVATSAFVDHIYHDESVKITLQKLIIDARNSQQLPQLPLYSQGIC